MTNLFRRLIAGLTLSGLLCACAADAADVRLDDSYGDAFSNYQPYVVPGKKPEEKPRAAAAPAAKNEATGEQQVTVKWLQQNYPKLEQRAIDDPTDANVSAYLYAKRIVLDKSQRFSEKVMEVNNRDPFLTENNRIPYASSGAQSIRSADRLAQEQAVRELSAVGGLVVFVDSTCRFCSMQMPIVTALHNNYGTEALVVSLDGSRPKGYTGKVVKDNGLFRKLDLKLTPSIVYIHKPKGYTGQDTNDYRIIAQGYYAQDELVKQIAFAGHSTHILSVDTMRDLDVWDRGVASTDDLNQLKLDVDKPDTFAQKLQPILQKQY